MKIAGRFLPGGDKAAGPDAQSRAGRRDEFQVCRGIELRHFPEWSSDTAAMSIIFTTATTSPRHHPVGVWLNAGRRTDLGKLVTPTTVINRVELHQIRQTASN
jgi:hypothetical protein